MCFKAKTPKIPPKPQQLTPDEATQRAEDETRRRLAFREGRRGTILTSALGDPNFGTSSRRRDLIGGGGGGV